MNYEGCCCRLLTANECSAADHSTAAMTAMQGPAAEQAWQWRSPIGCTQAPTEATDFLQWCNKRKILFPKAKLATSDTTGRCMVATADITTDEVVVEVPDDTVLMASSCSISEALSEAGLLKPTEDPELEVQGLIIAVMVEKAAGRRSEWWPYLSIIPEDMGHLPFMWAPDEQSELVGTAGHDRMMGTFEPPPDAPYQARAAAHPPQGRHTCMHTSTQCAPAGQPSH